MPIQLLMAAFKFFNKGSVRGEKPISKTSLLTGVSLASWARILFRLCQFVMGLVVIGLYAQDLDKARRAHKYADPKWVYAVFCGALASLCSLVFMLPLLKSWFFFFLDWLVAFLFLVLFGMFGNMYLREKPEGNKGIIRMKNAVWIDLANLLLWTISGAYGTFIFFKHRKERTQYAVGAAVV
jgi:hypothetical protein